MDTLLNAMKEQNNQALTENGAPTYKSTMNGLMDLFALGGAYRARTDADIINLFQKAVKENESYALKCLFYLRDCRGGQGERHFFRVCSRWLANNHPEMIRRNMSEIPNVGRWDDFYAFVDTPLEDEVFEIMYEQLKLDVGSKTPSLLAKWLKSENTSSAESRKLARITRHHFNMTKYQYRKTLSILRERIKIVERLMSENRWDEIEFDKIPSRAGFIYRNAFARRDIINAKYEKFAKNTATGVNASTLNPCDIVNKARYVYGDLEDTERLMINKYWDNLNDYFHNAVFNGVAVVDTSGSMTGSWGTVKSGSIAPIDVAISLGMYCAEKCNPNSPWYGHYITFSKQARLVPVKGADFCDKVQRIVDENLCENTNIRSVFNLLLKLAVGYNIDPADMPQNIIVISDMEFDRCASFHNLGEYWAYDTISYESEMEEIANMWDSYGYEMPHLIFWNCEARQDNIPMKDNGRVTFVSGYSPSLFESILTGKTGLDLVKEKLDSPRYASIY